MIPTVISEVVVIRRDWRQSDVGFWTMIALAVVTMYVSTKAHTWGQWGGVFVLVIVFAYTAWPRLVRILTP